jgi:hypothetical protein
VTPDQGHNGFGVDPRVEDAFQRGVDLPGQVRHPRPHRAGDGDRQRPDRVRLVDHHHHQHPSVPGQPGEQLPQPGLVPGQAASNSRRPAGSSAQA